MIAPEWEVVIVGAGPVGLLLGNLLGASGVQTLVIDKRERSPEASMAIGLTPPSLALLHTLQLDQQFITAGVRVEQAVVHGNKEQLGSLSFHTLPGPYRFILSLPQAQTVRLLETRLGNWPRVTLRRATKLLALEQASGRVTASLQEGEELEIQRVHCDFLVGADGGRSRARRMAGIPIVTSSYPQNFVMGDFADQSNFGDQAHLFFTRHGSVESFPLPGGRRRWVVQTEERLEQVPPRFISQEVCLRTGINLDGSEVYFTSSYAVGRLLAKQYHDRRIALCGDAAHLMSPVGGQGMNVGFADAAWLAKVLIACCREGAEAEPLLADYGQNRRKAARIATGRAARGMWLGTRRGRFSCLWRDPLLRLLLAPPLRRWLPPHFAMLTLPNTFPAGD
jgi:2-polyprenyl-6-methoxyphenol hydroxylase-like FAD-dependent oxidoreductase